MNTQEGLEAYIQNDKDFNWGDFINFVPNSICLTYGIEKVDEIVFSSLIVSHDEQLVDENKVPLTDEEWEELKSGLFMVGIKAIEDFLGYELPAPDEEDDAIENRLDEAFDQMPSEEARKFYNDYC